MEHDEQRHLRLDLLPGRRGIASCPVLCCVHEDAPAKEALSILLGFLLSEADGSQARGHAWLSPSSKQKQDPSVTALAAALGSTGPHVSCTHCPLRLLPSPLNSLQCDFHPHPVYFGHGTPNRPFLPDPLSAWTLLSLPLSSSSRTPRSPSFSPVTLAFPTATPACSEM